MKGDKGVKSSPIFITYGCVKLALEFSGTLLGFDDYVSEYTSLSCLYGVTDYMQIWFLGT